MSYLGRELVFLILQFLDEEKFKETVHKLEQESGFYFNMKHFEEKLLAGEWNEVEAYLSGFTKLDDNRYSMKIFFEIRKQKYLEALDRRERGKAADILVNDLKIFSSYNQELYKEITQLLTLGNFRENEQLSRYGDAKSARSIMLVELKKLIEANPLFQEKLTFPTLRMSRLRSLINQSLNWQHQMCKNPRPNPEIKTLFADHVCPPVNGARAPAPVTIPIPAIPRPPSFQLLGTPVGSFPPPPAAGTSADAPAGWITTANPSSSVQQAVVAASSLPVTTNQVAVLKHPRTSSNTLGVMDPQGGDAEHSAKRMRTALSNDEIMYRSSQIESIPKKLMGYMHQGSALTSMDFHPYVQTLLVVGCANGDFALWEVGKRQKLVSNPFNIWEKSACSVLCQAAVANDSSISVSRVAWSPDGSTIGVAFSKHLIQLYAYHTSNDLRRHLEIDAHVGSVNDLAFARPSRQLYVVTCGDDKLIKVWDLHGRKLFSFEGHDAPVYSVCPREKENIQFIFSTSVNGKIKAWLYDNVGSRVDYDAPGQCRTRLLYSADGSRLFSCGTNNDGDTFLVEWNDSEGAIKRTYNGFNKKSSGAVQCEVIRNRFLAAGVDSQIKFWDMDYSNVLTSTDADGLLPYLPRLRFNKQGNLLAVTTIDEGFKILANAEGRRLIRAAEASHSGISRLTTNVKNPVDQIGSSVEKSQNLEGASGSAKPWELTEIVDPAQCRALTMPDSTDPASKVVRVLYTNSGIGVLALGSNGVLRVWKWMRSEHNPNRNATASIFPQLWQPNSGLNMKNDTPENAEEAVACIALSKNDSYSVSACGGEMSLFNMATFNVMHKFKPAPSASTFLAFHPLDNNILAIGMEDSTILVYNVRMDEVKSELKGHEKCITGLAFSTHLNILVSSSADTQLCFWNMDTWENKSMKIELPAGKSPDGDTRIQFHSDQVHLLVSHETQLAIYDASKMELICQWLPQDVLPASISSAIYSCNSKLVYASFADGNIGVFDADSLKLRCRIAPSSYMSSAQTAANSQPASPLSIAAHPRDQNQFAVGLSDGSVKVMEPLEQEGSWGFAVPVDNAVLNGNETSPNANNSNP